MTRYTLHVPETLNDGTAIPPIQLVGIETRIMDIAGGFTQTLGRGAWRGDDNLYFEPIRLYLIDADDSPQTARALQGLAADIADELDQEAVYLTRQDVETFLVTPARKESPDASAA